MRQSPALPTHRLPRGPRCFVADLRACPERQELADGDVDAANPLLPGGRRRVKLAQGTIFSKKNQFFPHGVISFLKPASLLSTRKSARNYRPRKKGLLEIFICS